MAKRRSIQMANQLPSLTTIVQQLRITTHFYCRKEHYVRTHVCNRTPNHNATYLCTLEIISAQSTCQTFFPELTRSLVTFRSTAPVHRVSQSPTHPASHTTMAKSGASPQKVVKSYYIRDHFNKCLVRF